MIDTRMVDWTADSLAAVLDAAASRVNAGRRSRLVAGNWTPDDVIAVVAGRPSGAWTDSGGGSRGPFGFGTTPRLGFAWCVSAGRRVARVRADVVPSRSDIMTDRIRPEVHVWSGCRGRAELYALMGDTPPDHAPFLQATLATPDDDLIWLVYADWLEEQGDHRHKRIRRIIGV